MTTDDTHDGGAARSAAVRHWWILAWMVLIGSSTATAAKFAVRELPVPLLPLVRFGGAGLVLLPLVWGRGSFLKLIRQDAGPLIAASLFCVPINQFFFLNASRWAPTTHVGLIYATCPLVVLVLAVCMRHERLAPARVLGIATSVLGAIVIALGTFTQAKGVGSSTLLGDLFLIGAVVSWGAYLAINKRLIVRHSALVVLSATFLIGTAFSIPLAIPSMAGWRTSLAQASPVAWGSLAYLTLVASLLGLACQNLALRRFDASHVANVGNLSPVLTVLWGVLLLGESVSPSLIIGGALTLVGIVVAGQRMSARTRREPESISSPCAHPRRLA